METKQFKIRVMRDLLSVHEKSDGRLGELPADSQMLLSKWLNSVAELLPANPRTIWSVHENGREGVVDALIIMDESGRYRIKLVVPDYQMRSFRTDQVYCRYFYMTSFMPSIDELERVVRNDVGLYPPYNITDLQRPVLRLIGHYDRFSRIASELHWKRAMMQVWNIVPEGSVRCIAYLIRFSERYDTLETGIVQAMLMQRAYLDPSLPDLRQLPRQERIRLLASESARFEPCVAFFKAKSIPQSPNSAQQSVIHFLPKGVHLPETVETVLRKGLCYDLGQRFPSRYTTLGAFDYSILFLEQ